MKASGAKPGHAMLQNESTEAFGRAYVACGYMLGLRGSELLQGIESSPALTSLQQRLGQPGRDARAAALAGELSKVVSTMLRQRLR
jgi:hypothetical protein